MSDWICSPKLRLLTTVRGARPRTILQQWWFRQDQYGNTLDDEWRDVPEVKEGLHARSTRLHP